jgi:hypothetical protein
MPAKTLPQSLADGGSVGPAQVTARWEKFTEEEHAQLAGMAFSLFQQGAVMPGLWDSTSLMELFRAAL